MTNAPTSVSKWGTVVGETLAVFRLPQIRKNCQCLDCQYFADDCTCHALVQFWKLLCVVQFWKLYYVSWSVFQNCYNQEIKCEASIWDLNEICYRIQSSAKHWQFFVCLKFKKTVNVWTAKWTGLFSKFLTEITIFKSFEKLWNKDSEFWTIIWLGCISL